MSILKYSDGYPWTEDSRMSNDERNYFIAKGVVRVFLFIAALVIFFGLTTWLGELIIEYEVKWIGLSSATIIGLGLSMAASAGVADKLTDRLYNLLVKIRKASETSEE